MKSPFSEGEEITTRKNLQSERILESSSGSGSGIRSFYFNNDEQREVSDENVTSMEFTMFHLDISSSRSSIPEETDCLTYNVDRNDGNDIEFQKRIDQIRADAYRNWLEGKLNLKKNQEKEKSLKEQKIREEKEREEQKVALIRERKLIEWFNRKKHEKEIKRVECSKSESDDADRNPTTFFYETKEDQTKLNFEAWKMKKLEKEKIQREMDEKRQRLRDTLKETKRNLSMEKHEMWLKTAHEKPRPVPLNQGLLSLRGSLYPIHCNPQPWISNI